MRQAILTTIIATSIITILLIYFLDVKFEKTVIKTRVVNGVVVKTYGR